jgi:hypothetical protein
MTESIAQDHLRLLLYRGTGGDTVPVAEYLAQRRDGAADWSPYLGLVGLDLTVAGEALWPSWKPIGDLARMAFQFEAAARRLRDGEQALARIAVDDFPIGGYLRFCPDGDRVSVSLINVSDPEVAYRYPVDADGSAVTEVYARIAGLTAEEASAAQQESGLPDLGDLSMLRDALASDLAGEAARGRELYDALGIAFDLELY